MSDEIKKEQEDSTPKWAEQLQHSMSQILEKVTAKPTEPQEDIQKVQVPPPPKPEPPQEPEELTPPQPPQEEHKKVTPFQKLMNYLF